MKNLTTALVYFALTGVATASPAYIQQSPFSNGAPALTIEAVDMSSLASHVNSILEPLSASDLPAASVLQTGLDHRAEIVQSGTDNLGLIVQQGASNSASLFQSGARNIGFIQQTGFNNSAMVRQTGNGHRAIVSQRGTGNVAIIRQY